MESELTPLLDQLLTLPTLENAKLSPDRHWVAFTWYRVHENADVFAVPTDGSAPPIALTRTPEYTEMVSWSPDSRSVIVREDHDGDERARLFRVSLNAPEVLIPLTEDHPPYYLRGGSLHPDGTMLFYGMNYDVESGQEIEPTWIYRHDLKTGKRTAIGRPNRAFKAVPHLNQQATHLIYTRRGRHRVDGL